MKKVRMKFSFFSLRERVMFRCTFRECQKEKKWPDKKTFSFRQEKDQKIHVHLWQKKVRKKELKNHHGASSYNKTFSLPTFSSLNIITGEEYEKKPRKNLSFELNDYYMNVFGPGHLSVFTFKFFHPPSIVQKRRLKARIICQISQNLFLPPGKVHFMHQEMKLYLELPRPQKENQMSRIAIFCFTKLFAGRPGGKRQNFYCQFKSKSFFPFWVREGPWISDLFHARHR